MGKTVYTSMKSLVEIPSRFLSSNMIQCFNATFALLLDGYR